MTGYHALVLAAGMGSRFGGSKLTAPWRDGVLLEAALRSARAAPVASVVVVTGAHEHAVEAVVRVFASSPTVVRTIRCVDHASGMSASLRSGLAALPADARGAFIFLGDMPLVPPELPNLMLEAVQAGALAAVPASNERIGHPVLISRALFASFSEGAGNGGGRRILRELGDKLARIEISDDGVFVDIDTKDDLDRSAATS